MRLQNKCERSENESRRKTTSFSSYSIVIYSLIVQSERLLLDNNLLGLTIRLDDINTAACDTVDLGTIDGIDGWLAV